MKLKTLVQMTLVASIVSACGQTSESKPESGRGFKKFLVASCPSLSPELGGHNTLYLTSLVPNSGSQKVTALVATALEWAPSISASFLHAEQDGDDVVVHVGKAQIQTSNGFRQIEGIRLNKKERSVFVTFYVPGADGDVHVDAMHFENCNVQNTKLLLKGSL